MGFFNYNPTPFCLTYYIQIFYFTTYWKTAQIEKEGRKNYEEIYKRNVI